MQVPVIRSDDDLTAALKAIDALWNAEPGSEDGDRLDALVALVAAYEDRHFPIPKATPVEVLKFAMEQRGRTQADLGRLLGSRSRASEILNGRRELTLEQIRVVAREWKVPAGALIDLGVGAACP